MTIEQIDKIISDLRQQIPSLQMQLNQAEGYKQALVDMEKPEEEETEDN
jgi:prefoldin subunit 5